ncbi:MAG: carboxymethylenebutenolidase [Actinomycetia bacterium]|nr:carboxymethylenebutenolidase [Actinomycetes bacterium]
MPEIALPYFLSLPATPGPWPGVVVIHEGNGMSPQLLRVCQRLAAEGYAAIAPDLFFRVGGSGGADIPTMMGAVQDADIEEAASILRAAGAEKLGITGFCMGGQWSWHMATTSDTFSAAAGFYGARISTELHEPNCPTLLFFGDTDEYVPMTEIEKVRAFHPETFVYEGAQHGFMRDGSENYHEAAATDAWSRVLAHFGEHLL